MPAPDPSPSTPTLRRHRGAATLLILGLVLGLVPTGCHEQSRAGEPPPAPPPPPVTVAKPVVKEIQEADEFTGRFDAVASVDIRARVGGTLEEVHFKDGAEVKEGTPLFVIDRRPYQAAYDAAVAAVASIQTRLDFAKLELERADQLSRTGAAAGRTLDQARQQFLQAQADIVGARAAVETARLNLDFTEIRAPISGRIGRKLVTEGNLIDANTTLLTTIVALDPIHFYFDIDEKSFLSQTRAAGDAIRLAAIPLDTEIAVALADEAEPAHRGRLDFVDNRLDQATGTLRGRAVLDNRDRLLMPGLFGRIRIPHPGHARTVLVPDEAIAADLDRRTVITVAADGTVAPRVVVPGPRIDGYRVIRQGLTGDELIVIKGLQRARPGGKVTPQVTTLPPSR
jgi:RND family efflux transporter MFP subunit